MGARKGIRTQGGTRSGGAGAAAATLETHIPTNTHTHSGSQRAVAAGQVSDRAGLSVPPAGQFAAFRWGDGRPWPFTFIFKPNTDPATGWVEAVGGKRNETFVCRLV